MILSEEEAQEERDDGAPIEILEQYFEARGWACERTAEGEIVAFRCTGKRFLPIFLASFVVPRLALKLVRD